MLLTLGIVALIGLRPWATDSLVPDLGVSPGLGAAPGDAVAVGPGQALDAGDGRAAPAAPALAIAAGVPAPAPRATSSPALAVAPARALEVSAATPVAAPQPDPPAVPAPDPVPAAAAPPAAAPTTPGQPILAGADGGPGRPPGTAGSGGFDPAPECEGEEYTVTLVFAADAEDEESPVEILVQHLESDGTVSELRLEGSLSDAQGLIELLAAEGNCVEILLEPVSGGDGEAESPPEADAGPTELEYLPD